MPDRRDATERHRQGPDRQRLARVSGARVVAVTPLDTKRYIAILFVIDFGCPAWVTEHLTTENEVVETWVSEAVLVIADLNGPGVGPYGTLCSSFSASDPCTAMS